MIPLAECQHGQLYRVKSRNISLGVFNQHAQGFVGIRTKYDNDFLDFEIHWEADPNYGTVQPIEALEACPHEPTAKVIRIATEEDVKRIIGSSNPIKVGESFSAENEPLYRWLVEKEKQYTGQIYDGNN